MTTNSTDPEPKGTRTDRVVLIESLIVMVLAAGLYIVTFSFDEVPPILAQGIQPTVFPRVVLGIMFLLAVLQAISAMRVPAVKMASVKPYTGIPMIVLATLAAIVIFAVAMTLIGTFPTMIIFCPALAYLWGERRWKMMAFSFAGFLAFIYLLFVVLLGVPLP